MPKAHLNLQPKKKNVPKKKINNKMNMKPNSFHGPSILDWATTIPIRFLKVFVFTFSQS